MHQTFRTTAGILSAASFALSMMVLCAAPTRARAQSVGITISLDADTVEIIRAWRRQQGLDPPDMQADERFRALARRRQTARSRAVAAAAPAETPEDASDVPDQPAPRARP